MSSFVAQNWASITNDGHVEISPLDSDILMSLLEEAQFECSDDDHHDERLSSVIQSLAAEIDPVVKDDDHVSFVEDSQSSDQMDGFDCSTMVLDDHLDLISWVDMEMASSSPSDEMTNWYMEYYSCGDHEMDCVVGFEGVRDNYFYDDNHHDHELVDDGYSNSLWQETYESVTYG